MDSREIALEYIDQFCAGDIEKLEPLLASDLKLRGPLYTFDSAEAYLDRLRADPPAKTGYTILSATKAADTVMVTYEYQKPEGALSIEQRFTIVGGKIQDTELKFNVRGFK